MSEHEQTKSLLSNEERRELIKEQRAEIERLRAELASCPRDMQVADGMIRDLRADKVELLAALAKMCEKTPVPYKLETWVYDRNQCADIASAVIDKVRAND